MKLSHLALLIALVALAFGLFQSEQTKRALHNSQQSLIQLEDSLHSKMEDLGYSLQTQQRLNRPTRSEIENAGRFEIVMLIQSADTQLKITQDLSEALQSLNSARTKIEALRDPKVDPLKQALEQDLQALEAAQQVKAPLAWQQVMAIMAMAQDLLPPYQAAVYTAGAATVAETTPQVATTDSTPMGWQQQLYQALRTFKDLIKIRHREKPVEPLLSETEQRMVQQQLHLLLEQLRLATLMRDQALYLQLIQDTQQWLEQYYDAANPKVLSLQTSLDRLKTAPLQTTYPSLSCLSQLSLLRS